MSKPQARRKVPLAVRIAYLRDHTVPHDVAEVLADEMKHEYAGAIERIHTLSERIDDALAFLSFSSEGIACETPRYNQPGLCDGY
jgi:hypothetical protein